MIINIQENISNRDNINPDVIYNRCDLWADNYASVSIKCEKMEYNMMLSLDGDSCYLGAWLMNIPTNVMLESERAIFERFPQVKRIKYEYGLTPTGYASPKNHFRITLPDTDDELRARLSKKGRYNIKREKDILSKTFGGYDVVEYMAEGCPSEILDTYFKMKKATHNVDYHMTASEYIKFYHVSHVYVLKVGAEVGAILLSCEQCSVVYIENLTYDLRYAKYSCGQVLYDIYLTILIQKGYKELFLAGGNLDYKKRYGSVEEPIYNCIVFRNRFDHALYAIRECLRKVKNRIIQR